MEPEWPGVSLSVVAYIPPTPLEALSDTSLPTNAVFGRNRCVWGMEPEWPANLERTGTALSLAPHKRGSWSKRLPLGDGASLRETTAFWDGA